MQKKFDSFGTKFWVFDNCCLKLCQKGVLTWRLKPSTVKHLPTLSNGYFLKYQLSINWEWSEIKRIIKAEFLTKKCSGSLNFFRFYVHAILFILYTYKFFKIWHPVFKVTSSIRFIKINETQSYLLVKVYLKFPTIYLSFIWYLT